MKITRIYNLIYRIKEDGNPTLLLTVELMELFEKFDESIVAGFLKKCWQNPGDIIDFNSFIFSPEQDNMLAAEPSEQVNAVFDGCKKLAITVKSVFDKFI